MPVTNISDLLRSHSRNVNKRLQKRYKGGTKQHNDNSHFKAA